MSVSIVKIGIVVERDFLLLDGAHEALGIAILGRLASRGHTELGTDVVQRLHRRRGCVLDPLIRVMALGPMLRQCSPSGR